MSTDGVGDSFSGGDGFDELDSSLTGDLFESLEKSFLNLDLSILDSLSETEIAKTLALFWKAYNRTLLIAFALLGVLTFFQLMNLIFLSSTEFSIYVFFGLIFLLGYLYPIRVISGTIKNRLVFKYIKTREKVLILLSIGSLSIATLLSAYPITRDYYHYYIDSPGTCLRLVGEDESTVYFENVSCFSKKAFQVISYQNNSTEECRNSEFGIWEAWTGQFCLTEKRPPTEAELEILSR
jgi:hypothetical protein